MSRLRVLSLAVSVAVALSALGLAVRDASSAGLATRTLYATVGPGYTISVKNASGRRITRVAAGNYVLVVRDRSSVHDFHLSGTPSADRSTRVQFVGVVRWNISLISGVTYRYRCDAHPQMRGSFKAT